MKLILFSVRFVCASGFHRARPTFTSFSPSSIALKNSHSCPLFGGYSCNRIRLHSEVLYLQSQLQDSSPVLRWVLNCAIATPPPADSISSRNYFKMAKYADDPEWVSVTPIPLDDGAESGATPLATIAYPPEYLEATSYLRAVMAVNEMSERALKLTEDVISKNPAHYTVW